MKAALFLENDRLCNLDETVRRKEIRISTITTEEDKVVSIKNSEVKIRNFNSFISWLVDRGIKMVYVSGIDEKIKRFFEQVKIIVNVKEKSDQTLLLSEITSRD